MNDKAITKQDSPLTASPYDTAPEPDHDALTNTTATTPTTAPMSTDTDSTAPENNNDSDTDTDTDTDTDSDNTQSTGENTGDERDEHAIPVSEIERLRDRVAFAVQIASRDTQLQHAHHAHHANATENTANTDDAMDGHTHTQQTTLPNTSTRHTRHAPNTSTWRQAFAAEILAEINRVLTTTSETREQATE